MKYILQIIIVITMYGFVGPALISMKADLPVIAGFLLVAGTVIYQGMWIIKQLKKLDL